MFGHIFFVLLGMALIACGFWGGYAYHKPYGALIAWCAPVGLVIMLVGIVLLFIPHFFA